MPPPPFFDLGELDFENPQLDRAGIEARIPQRHEFALLDALLFCDEGRKLFAGYHDVSPDDWWCRGHIPGRPLFPGVLMVETAAQISSIIYSLVVRDDIFLGFSAVDDVRFRGVIEPPARLVLLGQMRDLRPRRVVAGVQGFVEGKMVFESVVTGMPV